MLSPSGQGEMKPNRDMAARRVVTRVVMKDKDVKERVVMKEDAVLAKEDAKGRILTCEKCREQCHERIPTKKFGEYPIEVGWADGDFDRLVMEKWRAYLQTLQGGWRFKKRSFAIEAICVIAYNHARLHVIAHV